MTDPLTIPGYEIVRQLGRGGMASVFLAIQNSFKREVALKVMAPQLNVDPSFTTRFLREARIVASIHHASIVSVFDVGQHQSNNYLSMEYLSGGDLKQRIEQGGYDAEFAAYVCMALCAALDLAHRKGFVHRDVKPENVLFREDGTPILTDFGIARAIDSGTSFTMAGMMVGTPNYMSPEQVKGVKLDGRSDLYSLGIVFYQMLTGTVPFHADSSLSVALKHLSEPIPPLPPGLAAYQPVLDRLTAKEPDARFATGAEVIQALRELGEAQAQPDQTRVRVPRNPAVRMPASIPPVVIPAVQMSNVPNSKRGWLRRMRRAAGAVSSRVARVNDTAGVSRAAQMPGPVIASRLPTFNLRVPPWVGVLVAIGAGVGGGLLLRDGDWRFHHVSESIAVTPPPASPTSASVLAPVQDASPTAATNPPAEPQQAADQAAIRARVAEVERSRQQAEQRAQKQEKARVEQQQIDNRLAEARKRYANGFSIEPKGASAVDSYRAILDLRPGHAAAQAGLQRIAGILVAEAERSELAGDLATQRRLIEQLRSIQPHHPQLAGLLTGLAQNEVVPRQLPSLERARIEDAARHIGKAEAYLARTPVTWRVVDDATIQYDSAKSAALLAPGLPYLKDRIIANYATAVRTELDRNDPQSAMKVIECARERGSNWFSPELEELEIIVRKAL